MPPLEAVHTTTRADAWHVGNAHCRARYHLLAEAEPDVLCRVLNHFALQCLTPCHVGAVREDDLLAIDIEVEGLSWHRAQVIGEKLRNLISVYTVTLEKTEATWAEPAHAAG